MIKINLLTEVKQKYREKGGKAAAAGDSPFALNNLLIIGMILIGLGYCGFMYFKLKQRQDQLAGEIAQAQVERDRLKKVLEEVKKFELKKTRLQKKIDLINDLKRNQKGPVRIMDEISKELPELLWLDTLELRGDALTVKGRALNLNAIGTYIDNIKGNTYFSEPVLREINLTGGPSYAFSMNFNYRPPAPKPEEAGAAHPAGA